MDRVARTNERHTPPTAKNTRNRHVPHGLEAPRGTEAPRKNAPNECAEATGADLASGVGAAILDGEERRHPVPQECDGMAARRRAAEDGGDREVDEAGDAG